MHEIHDFIQNSAISTETFHSSYGDLLTPVAYSQGGKSTKSNRPLAGGGSRLKKIVDKFARSPLDHLSIIFQRDSIRWKFLSLSSLIMLETDLIPKYMKSC